jgi:hypothetical protein
MVALTRRPTSTASLCTLAKTSASDVKATLVSHAPVPDEDSAEIHRFEFVLEDNAGRSPYRGMISLRTARVLVANVEDRHAFIGMLRAIVTTATDDYDSLIGQHFDDRF